MAQIICEVSKGLRDAEATVMVKDVHGAKHFLPVDREFLTAKKNRYYLPVGIIHVDESKGLALIELPWEADSGTSRILVRSDSLIDFSETPT